MTVNRSRRCVILSRRVFQYLLPAGIPGRWVTRGVEEARGDPLALVATLDCACSWQPDFTPAGFRRDRHAQPSSGASV